MSYEFFMGEMLCPVAPPKLELKVKGKNKTLTLINDGEVNLLKQAGLTEISFELLLPNAKYPFAVYEDGFKDANYFLTELAKFKTEEKPFQFIVNRKLPNGTLLFDTNMKVSLEDYSIKEDANSGFDMTVSIKLKQYKDHGTKVCEVTIQDEKPKASIKQNRPTETAPKLPTTYLVKNGDTLWNIAKKHYGDGSKFKDITKANPKKVQNANLIYVGQVLNIPKV